MCTAKVAAICRWWTGCSGEPPQGQSLTSAGLRTWPLTHCALSIGFPCLGIGGHVASEAFFTLLTILLRRSQCALLTCFLSFPSEY